MRTSHRPRRSVQPSGRVRRTAYGELRTPHTCMLQRVPLRGMFPLTRDSPGAFQAAAAWEAVEAGKVVDHT